MIAISEQTEDIRNERLTENNVQVRATTDTEEFMQILRRENVILAAVDYEYGMKENKNSLSTTDICTEGSRVFSDIRTDYADLPVYILHGDRGYSYSRTEKDELCHRGISGFIRRENIKTELLFIDKVDAIARDRRQTGSNFILNALLTEMNGFKKVDNKPVFVMAATNMEEEDLDRAFLRRFDRTSRVNLPGEKGRRWMLEHSILNHKDMFDVSENEISSIVLRSEGKSFADLENVIEAALREAIRADVIVNDSLLDETFEELFYGEE